MATATAKAADLEIGDPGNGYGRSQRQQALARCQRYEITAKAKATAGRFAMRDYFFARAGREIS